MLKSTFANMKNIFAAREIILAADTVFDGAKSNFADKNRFFECQKILILIEATSEMISNDTFVRNII